MSLRANSKRPNSGVFQTVSSTMIFMFIVFSGQPSRAEHAREFDRARQKAQQVGQFAVNDVAKGLIKLANAADKEVDGKGVGTSAAVAAGPGLGGFIEGLRFGNKAHAYCGPSILGVTDATANASGYAIASSSECNAKTYAGATLGFGLSATVDAFGGEVGAQATYATGLDEEKFERKVDDKTTAGAAFLRDMKFELDKITQGSFKTLVAAIDAMQGKDNGKLAPQAMALLNMIKSMVTQQAKVGTVLASSLFKNKNLQDQLLRVAGGKPPSMKKILGELKKDLVKKDPLLKGVADNLDKLAEMLNGCDVLSAGVTGGVGLVPVTATVSFNYVSQIGSGVSLDHVRKLAPDARDGAIAMFSAGGAVARKVADIVDGFEDGEKDTVKKVGLVGANTGVFLGTCVTPAIKPMCKIARTFEAVIGLPVPAEVIAPIISFCESEKKEPAKALAVARKAANDAKLEEKTEKRLAKQKEDRKNEEEASKPRRPRSPAVAYDNRRYLLKHHRALTESLEKITPETLAAMKEGEVKTFNPLVSRIAEWKKGGKTAEKDPFVLKIKRVGDKVEIVEFYPEGKEDQRLQVPVLYPGRTSKRAWLKSKPSDLVADSNPTADGLDELLLKNQSKLVALKPGESLRGSVALADVGVTAKAATRVVGKDEREDFAVTHFDYDLTKTKSGEIKIEKFEPTSK